MAKSTLKHQGSYRAAGHGRRQKYDKVDEDEKTQIMYITLEEGKRYAHTAACKYQLKMASLQPDERRQPNCACNMINESKRSKSRSFEDRNKVTVIVEHDLKEYILCILDSETEPQCKLDLIIKEGEQVAFKTIGHIPVQLSGVSAEAH